MFEAIWQFGDGATERQTFVELDEAKRRADSLLISYLAEYGPPVTVLVRDELGRDVHRRIQG